MVNNYKRCDHLPFLFLLKKFIQNTAGLYMPALRSPTAGKYISLMLIIKKIIRCNSDKNTQKTCPPAMVA